VLDTQSQGRRAPRGERLSKAFGRCLLTASVVTAAVLLMLGRAESSTPVTSRSAAGHPQIFETIPAPRTTSSTTSSSVPVVIAPSTGSVHAVTPATVVTRQSGVTPTTTAAAQNLSAALAALWRTQSSGNLAFRIGGQVAVIENTRARTISKGTGMVLTPDGLVLTNAHVVADPGRIVATVGGNGPRFAVRIVGADLVHDVAVVQLVGAAGLPVVTTGSASLIDLGSAVIAVGNAASGATSLTASSGLVIDLNHTLRAVDPGHPDEVLNNLIAFVAPVEAGDSGGPLVDSAGDVVGMVTAGGLDTAGVMVGYAIPIDTALSIAHQLIGA